MTASTFLFRGAAVPFRPGETIAAALTAAGLRTFGLDPAGRETRYFCGIGACQACLVRVDGVLVEACLTPARADGRVEPAEDRHDRS
ncbi:2Fe-2S iron-sulfur cluster-binding protein [Pinisolibacter aquiterrae]|uniref:2Fe-2S iron-sulfur cluster-binding protein n=1 Tax=Pinisolibacter aquiterrae TaxID=2815579 RepID=UPI001C3D9F82|nr:2Fe-2S iron-sulfur cluster-binding protein [Pinisolibacter aquiterrae]MBV5265761.1 (2Fe-2S)-binding protein [Pinisolibacter aquiterrae]MCC8236674.1 (2Fe-2S)-binding protein [Pinisolibacter aquiterrae]